MTQQEIKIQEAQSILSDLGMPNEQQNERTALCLLCLLNLTPDQKWNEASDPLIGISPMILWFNQHYQKKYAPNSREMIRRQSMHQLVDAAICLYNPDQPNRAVNSPNAVYQIEPHLLNLLRNYGTASYPNLLVEYQSQRISLSERYAREREMMMIPVTISNQQTIKLSSGVHSQLIKQMIESFGSRYVPNGQLIYVGDTGDKYEFFDIDLLKSLNVILDHHGKLPDVMIYHVEKNWLFLMEAVTTHGPIDQKRYIELNQLFEKSTAGLVFVSAFLDAKTFSKYVTKIAWETEVWLAESPTHMIHFNGSRFLGPYHDKNG